MSDYPLPDNEVGTDEKNMLDTFKKNQSKCGLEVEFEMAVELMVDRVRAIVAGLDF
jgi:hypothetical protein